MKAKDTKDHKCSQCDNIVLSMESKQVKDYYILRRIKKGKMEFALLCIDCMQVYDVVARFKKLGYSVLTSITANR